ncbi:MAG: hypothetical protein AAFY71_04075 [Bacteroidota bacterium]
MRNFINTIITMMMHNRMTRHKIRSMPLNQDQTELWMTTSEVQYPSFLVLA